jgi:hypothetical protein
MNYLRIISLERGALPGTVGGQRLILLQEEDRMTGGQTAACCGSLRRGQVTTIELFFGLVYLYHHAALAPCLQSHLRGVACCPGGGLVGLGLHRRGHQLS